MNRYTQCVHLCFTVLHPLCKLCNVNYEFDDETTYGQLYTDPKYTAGFPPAIVSKFRQRMQQIRDAKDERDFYALKSLRFEKLKGNRSHQHSIRINDQWRLVIELIGKGTDKVVRIICIEDYH